MGGRQLDNLRYADDTTLLAEKKQMAITEEPPTAGECPRATSLQRIYI